MKLVPIILVIVGTAVGTGAGLFLAPAKEKAECAEDPCAETAETGHDTKDEGDENEASREYIRMKNQFVVPVVRDEIIRSLVVLSLSLETEPGSSDTIHEREPKLRDSFLRVLFDHAHIGGFDGQFTESGRLSLLRVALLESAQAVIGPDITDILITDIVRQEM